MPLPTTMASPFSTSAARALLPASTSRPLSLAAAASSGRIPASRKGLGFRRGRFAVCNVAAPAAAAEQLATASSAKESQRPVYPFAAIVGQDEMKLCLLLNVIDPKIGGVMIMGDRGTGKSTTVRSLVDLLPDIRVVVGDPFNSDPDDPEVMGPEVRERVLQGDTGLPVTTAKITMVDLPLGATEDRVCGTIDIEKALTEGVKAFEPGLLAKANRGILYVDEVNLLDDHLVDVLLDSAASGWNTVEREGISISHPARFILIGSGNPEEGELRPQLLDRFGMHAQVGTVRDAELRVKIVEERARFDRDPKAFRDSYKEEQEKLQDQISSARTNLVHGAVAVRADVSDPDAVRALFDRAEEAFGSPPHVVVACAGLLDTKYPALADTAVEDFDALFAVNVRGTFLVCREAAKRIPASSGGRIVTFSSSIVGTLLPGYAAYTATNAAVEAMTRILAKEVAAKGVTANVVAPGPVRTELFLAGKDEAFLRRVEEASMGRIAETTDVAPVVAFLASDAAAWVNGQVIRVNGGFV